MPVALEKLNWKGLFNPRPIAGSDSDSNAVSVYLIFMCWDLFEVIVIYFFVVETKGFTLEEIGEIFGQPNPRKFSDELLRNARQNRGA